MIIAGKYEVLAELGRGGMGVVHQVRHAGLGAVYAVKTLPADLARDAHLVARFQQEARIMAALHHPNIVRVSDVGHDENLHFFVMEYVDGTSLHQILARGPLAIGEVLDIAVCVADALRHAHEHDPPVIHRDVKPSNILIERGTGRAVVTDFGIAKTIGLESDVHTRTGVLIGTVKYCAPEQLRGEDVDARADVFAFGLVLHEMIGGRHPLSGRNESEMIACARDESTEYPLSLPPHVPDALRAVITRAVAKKREARYPTMRELLGDLVEIRRTLTAPTVVPRPRDAEASRGRSVAIMVATVLLVASVTFMASRELRRAGRDALTAFGTSPTVGTAEPPPAPSARRERSDTRAAGAEGVADTTRVRAIGVMDFTPVVPDPSVAWMRDVIRDNLSSQLSGAPDCKVFSKEFIDFKAQGLLNKGSYSDLRVATMEVAEQLGVTKAIFGSYRTQGREGLYIEAHVVDMQTGVQEPADSVEGDVAGFPDLQRRLATKLMARLNIAAPAVANVGHTDTLEGYKLLLDAEGGSAAPSNAAPPDRAGPRTGALPRHGWGALHLLARLVDRIAPSSALADDHAPEDARVEILRTIEKYRRAYESKDLALLAEVYGSLSPEQATAAQQYFANADHLQVAIDDIDVAVEGDRAAVSYTRRDKFVDAKTGEEHALQVRLTKLLVHNDNRWTIGPNAK